MHPIMIRGIRMDEPPSYDDVGWASCQPAGYGPGETHRQPTITRMDKPPSYHDAGRMPWWHRVLYGISVCAWSGTHVLQHPHELAYARWSARIEVKCDKVKCDEVSDDDVPGSADTVAIYGMCNEVFGYAMHGEHHCHKENGMEATKYFLAIGMIR